MQDGRKILILGASGMLGNALLRFFSQSEGFTAVGTVRSGRAAAMLPQALRKNVITGIDVQDVDSVTKLLTDVRPQVVVNCVGVVKQLAEADDPLVTIPINSILPHRLARLCALSGARLVHLSTDCVFSGKKGMYSEIDQPDCTDLYGRSKLLGEVDYPNAITLRTSIIGHELGGAQGLLNWFLSQQGQVNGYNKAIFSGFPTVEIARIVRDYVLPNPQLRGVYQVSAAPIAKFDLLRLVAEVYQKTIDIVPDERVAIDRSLNSERFRKATGYVPPAWPELVATMHRFG
jgi:dTDP-4-dehydrorhamnose reductase